MSPLFTKFCKFEILFITQILDMNRRIKFPGFFLHADKNVAHDTITWLQNNHVMMSNMPNFGQWSNVIAYCDDILRSLKKGWGWKFVVQGNNTLLASFSSVLIFVLGFRSLSSKWTLIKTSVTRIFNRAMWVYW